MIMLRQLQKFVLAFTFVAILAGVKAFAEESVDIGTKLKMNVPEAWETIKPRSSMIQYEFKAPKDEKEDTARITVMSASGGVQANIDRWIGQFDQAKKEDAKVEDVESAGVKVHIVDISGTFKESMGGPAAPGPMKKRENYRMLGAIIETDGEGTVFIKMTGPQKTLEALAEDFRKSVSDLQKNK